MTFQATPHRFFCAAAYRWCGNGCPPSDRLALCKAYIAKAVWDFATTRDLIDAIRHRPALRRLCGWETLGEVPSEATFSRAFDAFARDGRPQQIHEAPIKTHCGEKLVGHVSRNATAIHAREKAEAKPKALLPEPRRGRRGGRRRDEPPAPLPDPTRLQCQLERDLQANLADLPTACDWGCKKNSRSKVECWRGYKLYLDVMDGDIPVSAILTSTSLHDSQVAIPLAQMSAERIVSLYDLVHTPCPPRGISVYRGVAPTFFNASIIARLPATGTTLSFASCQAQIAQPTTAIACRAA